MVSVQRPQLRPGAVGLGCCLDFLQQNWRNEGQLAGLWQSWPSIAGAQLAPHCRPMALRGRTLVVAVSDLQWLQALRYSKHQLLAALVAAGFPIQSLLFEQRDRPPSAEPFSQEQQRSWNDHPCRNKAGMVACPQCKLPCPAGEVKRWNRCSLCLRQAESVQLRATLSGEERP
jgi:predicted nucleic acid-binding Zn ribbon protein